MKKKNFIESTALATIGFIEVFKAVVGFFTWITLKSWWDKKAKKAKDESNGSLSGEEPK
jgi:hypothetical protein